jgi:hypothetical protein
MKNFFVAAIVCIAVLYGVDSYFFNGQYYGAFFGMARQIYQHAR